MFYTQENMRKKLQRPDAKPIVLADHSTYEAGIADMKNLMAKFEKITDKQKCLRVRFLDWFAAKLLSWSKSVQQMANNIDSPCMIKITTDKGNK